MPKLHQESNASRSNHAIDSIIETIDIFPTLCDLTDVPRPTFAQGTSLLPLLDGSAEASQADSGTEAGIAISYTAKASTIRTNKYRLIVHNDGFAELYDHRKDGSETKNLAADLPEIVKSLTRTIRERLGR